MKITVRIIATAKMAPIIMPAIAPPPNFFLRDRRYVVAVDDEAGDVGELSDGDDVMVFDAVALEDMVERVGEEVGVGVEVPT